MNLNNFQSWLRLKSQATEITQRIELQETLSRTGKIVADRLRQELAAVVECMEDIRKAQQPRKGNHLYQVGDE